jgi:hypothetical protein
MNTENEMNRAAKAAKNARELGLWSRRYARSRTMGVIVSLAIYSVGFVGLGLLWHGAGLAYRSESWVLLSLCIVGLAPAHILIVYVSLTKSGMTRFEQFVNRYYTNEGTVQIEYYLSRKWMMRLGVLSGFVFGSCIIGNVALGLFGYVSLKYQQPQSALYLVPFLVMLWYLMRPQLPAFALLWPGLYGLHAILVVAGAPIQFTGSLTALNMLLPVVGYGLLSALIGHAYNRYALRKLKSLRGEADNGTEE